MPSNHNGHLISFPCISLSPVTIPWSSSEQHPFLSHHPGPLGESYFRLQWRTNAPGLVSQRWVCDSSQFKHTKLERILRLC